MQLQQQATSSPLLVLENQQHRRALGRDAIVEEAKSYGLSEAAFSSFLRQLEINEPSNVKLDSRSYLAAARSRLANDPVGVKAVDELVYIVDRAHELGFADRLVVDPTLARGLDYYTGPIFEAKAHVEKFGSHLSFAGGGRYDDLIGLYGGQPQGAVGFSFGVERLIDLLKEQSIREIDIKRPVLIAPLGVHCVSAACSLAMDLRCAGIAARVSLGAHAPGKHLQYAEALHVDQVVFVGESEIKEQIFACKQLSTRKELAVARAALGEHLREAGVLTLD